MHRGYAGERWALRLVCDRGAAAAARNALAGPAYSAEQLDHFLDFQPRNNRTSSSFFSGASDSSCGAPDARMVWRICSR
jgi:hypothetical protein